MRKLLHFSIPLVISMVLSLLTGACQQKKEESNSSSTTSDIAPDTTLSSTMSDTLDAISEPLVDHKYTADPSAHVFDGTLYIYPSHDIDTGVPEDDMGSHFDMKDYHVFSMEQPGGEVTDHGEVLNVKNVPWAVRQMWAPDAARKGDDYYLYFPAKNEEDVFRIGVGTGDSPTGPFDAEPEPIEGAYSIDPTVFEDTDGSYYLYFGGIWGGQLQRWQTGQYVNEDKYPGEDEAALTPKVAKLSDDMISLAEQPRDVQILDKEGDPLKAGDNERRFFEGAWIHKYDGKYYLSYSTGDTHFIVYAVGDNPYGPFRFKGKILLPVIGWTTHHSIVKFKGQWYLFYHDSELSGGQTHLRNIKMTELTHKPDGTIQTIDPYRK